MTALWAILHTPSGKLLPVPETTRSGTWVELDDKRPPRLFRTRTGASNALRHWLAGRQSIKHGYDAMTGDDWHRTLVEPRLDRDPAAMAIVEVSIRIHLELSS